MRKTHSVTELLEETCSWFSGSCALKFVFKERKEERERDVGGKRRRERAVKSEHED